MYSGQQAWDRRECSKPVAAHTPTSNQTASTQNYQVSEANQLVLLNPIILIVRTFLHLSVLFSTWSVLIVFPNSPFAPILVPCSMYKFHADKKSNDLLNGFVLINLEMFGLPLEK